MRSTITYCLSLIDSKAEKMVDWGVLTYTMHPYVIGRGYRMLALEQVVDQLSRESAVFMTLENAAREAE